MPLVNVIFGAAVAVTLIATPAVVCSKNPVYAVLYLILSLFGVSLIFYTLGAHFLAVLEIIVYAGAIMVLFLFVVQMLSPGSGPNREADLSMPGWKHVVLPYFLAGTLIVFTGVAFLNDVGFMTPEAQVVFDAKTLGIALFQKHYLGVELASLILLIGMVGGMHLGRAASANPENDQ
jgi:NADH-quinone oxidoreductase subunit J